MKKYKLVIFDMDGTLYDLSDVIEFNYCMQLNFYSKYYKISTDNAVEIFEKNGIFPKITKASKSATEFFSKNGVDMKLWEKYRNENFDVKIINRNNAVSDETIKKFKTMFKIVLLTSNTYENVNKILKYLNIKVDNFDYIVCSNLNYPFEVFNKSVAIKFISEKSSVNLSNMVSIGDRYNSDIKPMVELGGSGVLINTPHEMEDIYFNISHGIIDRSKGFFCNSL